MPEPSSPPGDARCLAGLCAALEASRGEPHERVLTGFAEALLVDLAALLQLRDGAAGLRVLGARERRPAVEAELRLPAAWSAALAEGRVVTGLASELGPGERAHLRLAPTGGLLLAPVPALDGPPGAAVMIASGLADRTWSSGQELALRGLASGLAGWLTARACQQVLDALPQRVAWKDAGLRYRGANRAFIRAAGLGGPQLLGRVDAELPLRAESGDHGEVALRRERAAVTAPQVRHLELVPLPGGRELWFEVSRVPLEGGGLLVVRDEVTARVQLGQQLQLAQRTAAIGRLAAGVGAELRPLVTEICAAISAARGEPATASASLARIDRCTRGVDDLARQLAAFSRRQIVEPAEVSPGQLLARMEPTLTRLLGDRVRLRLAPPALRSSARIDPRLLEQLLAALAVHLRERLEGRGLVSFEVAPESLDEGRALALALPVGEYVRLGLRAEPGSGHEPPRAPDSEHDLRLALARTISAQAGGGLRSDERHGGADLRIDVYLPRVFAAPRADDPAPRPVVDLRGAESLLLIEDEPALALTLATVLRHLGYIVTVADDLAGGLARLQLTCPPGQVAAPRPALALLSAGLPAPGDALRRLRAALPDLRVLWLASAGASTPGGDPLVVPCSFEALALRVRQALDARPT